MCAAIRLSLTSAVCEPVTSMLKIVAVNVMDVIASLMKKEAVPKDAGRGAPPTSVGFVAGFSCAFVRFATRIVEADTLTATARIAAITKIPSLMVPPSCERALIEGMLEADKMRSGRRQLLARSRCSE